MEVEGRRRGARAALDGVEILGPPHVDLEFQSVERVARFAHDAIRLPEQGVDVGERLARLRRDVAGMNRLVADDARCARDEEVGAARFAQHARPREAGAVSPELLRIVIGAGLARVLDHLRRLATREKVNRYRAAGPGDPSAARRRYAHHGSDGPRRERRPGERN